MISDKELEKLREQIAAWPMAQRFTAQRLIEEYLRDREDLRVYQATGLTPESVEALKLSAMGKAIAEVKEFNGLPVDHLRKLEEADKDGRVVVLPCKVGDTVYLIVTKRARTYTPEFRFIKKSRLTFLNMERVLQDLGRTAFLTREEAEKALEE